MEVEYLSSIKASEFISVIKYHNIWIQKVCLTLSRRASEIIKEVYESGKLEKEFKIEDDPVTKADFMAQFIIETGLERSFPNLRIVGEEGDKGLPSDFEFEKLDKDIFESLLIPLIEEDSENLDQEELIKYKDKVYKGKDMCVLIDPLDGTKPFVEGKLSAVTTLIMLCVDSTPVIGVIAQAFELGNDAFQPITYVACRDIPRVIAVQNNGYYEHDIIQIFRPFKQLENEDKM